MFSKMIAETGGVQTQGENGKRREGRRAVKKKKKKPGKRIGFRVAAGVMDVFGAAGAALVIVVLLLMLGSLFSWLRQDLSMTFADLTDNFTDAVIIDNQ